MTQSIMELASKHLNRHPNDKSMRYLATMRRRFGPLKTTRALKKSIETYGLVFPELMAMLKAHDEGERHTKHGNINLDRIMITEPFYQPARPKKSFITGKSAKFFLIDDWA